MLEGKHLPTQHQQIQTLQAKYNHSINNGDYKPYVYPLGSFGVFIVILYFLIPHRGRPLLASLRYVVWAANLCFSLYTILNFRVRVMPADYGVGLITWWFVLWTTAIMITYDGQVEFARIERDESGRKMLGNPKDENGEVMFSANGHDTRNGKNKANNTLHLKWQEYPVDSMVERLDWVLDLLSNFRGMSWNWRIPSIPDPPKEVQDALKSQNHNSIKQLSPPRPGQKPVSREQLLRDAKYWLVIGYLALDFLRTVTIHDPYFRGLGSEHTITYLPGILKFSPAFHRAYRLLIGLFAAYWALGTIFLLAPLFFCGHLDPNLIGVRGEAWMYPKEWGSYTSVFDRGLAGWWGIWWHQTFRFAFEAPSRKLIEKLNIDRRSFKGKALQMFIAFALSGSLHACGSITSIGDTRPLRGPFTFFILQPFGIMGQALLAKAFHKTGITHRLPVVLRRVSNFVFVHFWFFFTAPLLIDDMASGGLFLYEPVPFSIFRLLRLGGKDESSICWSSPLTWLKWHRADVWWQSGLAI
jgi:hypothetical protein